MGCYWFPVKEVPCNSFRIVVGERDRLKCACNSTVEVVLKDVATRRGWVVTMRFDLECTRFYGL